MTKPRVNRLHVHVAGDATQVPLVVNAWTAFVESIALPFEYGDVKFGVCGRTKSSRAELKVTNGDATISMTPKCLDDPRIERHLTLLHESLHIAAFVGPLGDMYKRVLRLWASPAYAFVPPIAHTLGAYMFEVDAELALATLYPEHAGDRLAYYLKLQEEARLQDWQSAIAVEDPLRPYYVLVDRLGAELAGVLATDEGIEIKLNAHLEQPAPEVAERVEALRRMLSPKLNDYAELASWGAARYAEILSHPFWFRP